VQSAPSASISPDRQGIAANPFPKTGERTTTMVIRVEIGWASTAMPTPT
jgi:hypothetical protein